MFLDYCAITDGVTTINLINDPNYALQDEEWTVAHVTLPDDSTIAAYHDVTHVLPITVTAASASIALRLAQRLVTLMQQATLWNAGGATRAVRLRARAAGATATRECVIRACDAISIPTPTAQLDGYAIALTITIRRRGRWLEEQPAPGAYGSQRSYTLTTALPNTLQIPSWTTMSDENDVLQPASVTWQCTSGSTTWRYPLVAAVARGTESQSSVTLSGIIRYDALDGADGVMYTQIADAANIPRGAGAIVLRYTPTTTTAQLSDSIAPVQPTPPVHTRSGTALVVMTVRANQLTATWTIRVRASNAYAAAYTQPVIYVPTTTDPVTLICGLVTLEPELDSAGARRGVQLLYVEITASTTAGTPTLDIDQIYVLDAGEPATRITIPTANSPLAVAAAFGGEAAEFWNYRNDDAVPTYRYAYYGNAEFVVYRTSMIGVLIGTANQYWIPHDSGFSSQYWSFTAIRRRAYLTPE